MVNSTNVTEERTNEQTDGQKLLIKYCIVLYHLYKILKTIEWLDKEKICNSICIGFNNFDEYKRT